MTEPNGREPWVEATQYTVCAVPRRYPRWRSWAVTVGHIAGTGKWWIASSTQAQPARFDDRDKALAAARELATKITRFGMTGAEYIARHNATHSDPKETP